MEKTNVRLIHSARLGLYHSSKAAVTILSETLRLELAPLGVTVITGMLGHIESSFHVNDSWQGLSESSTYKSVESQIAKSAEGKVGPKKEKAEDFARRFVDDVLRGASGQVWRGAMAQTVRAIGHHAPMSVLVRDDLILQGVLGPPRARNSRADYNVRTPYSCPVVGWTQWQKHRRKVDTGIEECILGKVSEL